ncbi:MAG: DEAD/DEAH box helicase [Victivallales bacterium]|nr:DEAD/DEAH box helicase [Victivallales bacterium]MCF7888815.1 DEAD/DEAH box helicase [Victivallales bacterium]
MSKPTFKDLGISENLLVSVKKRGYEEPTEVQSKTIPLMLEGNSNIIVQSQTGTGKTAAFGLPILDLIDCTDKSVQALILAPTRELAIQVSEEINSIKNSSDITIAPIYGGQSIDQQLRRLSKGVQIVVGTPGRIIDHLKRKTLKIKSIKHLILDEADEMLNMGFIEDIEKIMEHTNKDKKILLFSATMPNRIKELAQKYVRDYKHISIKKTGLTTRLTEQIYFEVKNSDKFEALTRIIDFSENFYGLIFCRTKNDVDTITAKLIDRSYDADAIHSDISQHQREKTLNKFKKTNINILIATDVAARGIDVNDLTHVINYSLPQDTDSYIHRIGRTGRAGKEGTAITFITPSEYGKLMRIQKTTKTNIQKKELPQVNDIVEFKNKRITEQLKKSIDDNISDFYKNWADKLLSEIPPSKLLSSILKYCFDEELNVDSYKNISEIKKKNSHDIKDNSKCRLFIALGRKDGVDEKKLIKMIKSKTSISESQIKEMQVMDKFSFITVPFKKSETIISMFKHKGKDRKPLITKAKNKK